MILLWNSAEMNVELTLVDDVRSVRYEWRAERMLAREMLAYLRDRLAEHGAGFEDLTGIGVFRGPGSFTGLRIGLTVLNTIADAQGIPIVGESGESWAERCRDRLAAGETDQVVLPEYGGDAHITKPRK